MPESSDLENLIRRAKRGDQEAFENLARRFEGKVFSIALKMLSNPHDAGDVVQETFLRVFRFLPKFDEARDFGVWVARIAMNCSYDCLKERGRADRFSLDALFEANPGVLRHDPSEGAEERLDRKRALAFLLEELPKLPLQQRSALVLKDLERYETSAVAEILNCDEATVRRHLSEARRKIRDAFEKAFPKA